MPEHPKLSQIIGKLHEATGLDLTVDPGLDRHQPDYGVFQPGKAGFHAWQLMEYIARRDLRYGYWRKTDGGYCLVGASTAAVAPPGPEEGVEGRIDRMAAVWGIVACTAVGVLANPLQEGRSRGQATGSRAGQIWRQGRSVICRKSP